MNGSHKLVMRIEWDVQKALVATMDSLIVGIGLLGHTLVIFILAGRRCKRGSRSLHGTDTLLLALSASDMLLLLSIPFHTAAIALGNWPFGNFLCKAISFLGIACNAVSVFTLAALAVTRYLTVVHPAWAYRSSMQRWLQISAALLWAPAVALAAPQFAFRTVGASGSTPCFAFLSDVSQVVYSITLFLFSFALPLVVIILMYAKLYKFLRQTRRQCNATQLERYQKKVSQTTALLVVVFTVCWLPSYILMFSRVGQRIDSTPNLRTIAIFARLLATCSSVVNPLLYAFVSRKFRQDLLELGRGHCRNCMMPHCLVHCPKRGRDMVHPFNHAELNTPSS